MTFADSAVRAEARAFSQLERNINGHNDSRNTRQRRRCNGARQLGDDCVRLRSALACDAHLRVFRIPACAKGEACALLSVTPRGDAIDLGDNRRFPFTITPREIAADIVQDLGDHGVFLCAGAEPSDEELAQARARRDAWYKQLVADADEMWARGHSYREISDMHRRAAAAMGLEREWAYVPQRSVDCPVCGEK